MALSYANIRREEYEVDLKNKPLGLLQCSPKATVPVLVLADGQVIEQSLDIIKWALRQSDPDKWLATALEPASEELIRVNDQQFKPILDNYKYSSRAEIHTPIYYREQAEKYLRQLNTLLRQHQYLLADRITLVDIAIFPFIRQFYKVDEQWFMESEFTFLRKWLHGFLESELFLQVMVKKT